MRTNRKQQGWTLPVVLAVALVVGLLRRVFGGRTSEREEIRLCRTVLARLHAKGRSRHAHESLGRFSARLSGEGAPEAAGLREFARAYERMRFAARMPEREELAQLRVLADRVR